MILAERRQRHRRSGLNVNSGPKDNTNCRFLLSPRVVLRRSANTTNRLNWEKSMFRSIPAAEPAFDVVAIPSEPVPLSVISLDLDVPAIGWAAYLKGRGIEVITDDIGRPAIARADARQLFDEHHESEARKREALERQERQFIDADKQWRSQLSPGVSWLDMPPGVAPAAAMLAVDEDSRVSVREQLLQQELAHLSNGNES